MKNIKIPESPVSGVAQNHFHSKKVSRRLYSTQHHAYKQQCHSFLFRSAGEGDGGGRGFFIKPYSNFKNTFDSGYNQQNRWHFPGKFRHFVTANKVEDIISDQNGSKTVPTGIPHAYMAYIWE